MGLACLPTLAGEPWYENFDSYPPGTRLNGIGGWYGWDNVPDAAGTVTNERSQSPDNSIVVSNPTGYDAVHPFDGYTSGQWVFTAYQYVPSNLDGMTYFILNNEYNHGGPYQWAVELHMDPVRGEVWEELRDPGGSHAVPLIYDRWVEIRNVIDLDLNTLDVFYDGQLVATGVWNVRGGPMEIANVDLYAPHEVGVFYDDLSLVPEPTACLLLLIGAAGLRRR